MNQRYHYQHEIYRGGATIREVARELGISRGTVLNIEKKAIAKIKKAIKARLPFGADISDFY